ncbi:MAG: ribbon-helix-helix domain-containing protein [Oscillatoria sp. PMC 1068.18]|nr:ribbon-helix-helix domain-containing protein [Oscillatoria sp. PMC 1076.18]MEC4987915.1 ribbon-helix-helix domain-containing protein [Oscillatoria sp. PMC 1068.18]
MTQWTLNISEQTDQRLRAFLQQQGRADELSIYVERAVNRCLLEDTVEQVKARNLAFDQQEIQDTVDEALNWARE